MTDRQIISKLLITDSIDTEVRISDIPPKARVIEKIAKLCETSDYMHIAQFVCSMYESEDSKAIDNIQYLYKAGGKSLIKSLFMNEPGNCHTFLIGVDNPVHELKLFKNCSVTIEDNETYTVEFDGNTIDNVVQIAVNSNKDYILCTTFVEGEDTDIVIKVKDMKLSSMHKASINELDMENMYDWLKIASRLEWYITD